MRQRPHLGTRARRPTPAPRRAGAAAVAAIALACWSFGCRGHGGGRGRAAKNPSSPAVALEASAGGGAVVAEVNGRPIYSDCVATQARAHDLDRPHALDECIDFELLAQAAARRGYAHRPAVLDVRKTEMVRAFIEHDFSPRSRTPAQVPAGRVQAAWHKIKPRFDHPEYRLVRALRAPIKAHTPAGAPQARAARALAFEIYDKLAREDDLTAKAFRQRASAIAGGRKLLDDGQLVVSRRGGQFPPALARAVFALSQTGMVAQPTRGPHGWEINLLIKIIPAKHEPLARFEPKLRDELYRALGRRDFLAWVKKLSKRYPIQVHPKRLAKAGAAAPFPGSSGGG